ncbi:hypothetical protein RB195_001011 [Necator americanus]|uniref:Uncharacterized protein n=1 Tax=Necator americanus TaxID=51031 RepID=A0ABR1DCB2_NECAM
MNDPFNSDYITFVFSDNLYEGGGSSAPQFEGDNVMCEHYDAFIEPEGKKRMVALGRYIGKIRKFSCLLTSSKKRLFNWHFWSPFARKLLAIAKNISNITLNRRMQRARFWFLIEISQQL